MKVLARSSYGIVLVVSILVWLSIGTDFSAAKAQSPGSGHDVVQSVSSAFGIDGTLRRIQPGRTPLSPGGERAGGPFQTNVCVDDDLSPEHREPIVEWGPDGAIYAVYCERATHYNPELVMFTRSTTGGTSWLAPAVRINDTAPNAVMTPALGVLADGTVVAAWSEMKFAPFNNEIRFARSTDAGATWSPSVVVHPLNPAVDYQRPALTVAGGRIVVSYWAEVGYPNARATVTWSDDIGLTWSAPVTVSSIFCAEDGAAPVVAYHAQRDEIGIVLRSSDRRVLFLRSPDRGESWLGPVQLNGVIASSVDYPDLDAAGGEYHVVWSDNRVGQYDTNVYYSASADGQIFAPEVRVNDALEGNQYEPHVRSGAGGDIHVCWIWNMPFQGQLDLYYSESLDGGSSWLSPCPRVNDVAYIVQPYVAWSSDLLTDSSGTAYLFWNDGRASGYYDNIYTSRNADPLAAPSETVRITAGFDCRLLGHPGPDPLVSLVLDSPVSGLRLDLVDPAGRRVGGLDRAATGPGRYDLALRSLAVGGELRPGAYYLRICAEGRTETRKALLIR